MFTGTLLEDASLGGHVDTGATTVDLPEQFLGDPLDPRLIGVWRSLPSRDAEGYDIDGETLAYTDGDTEQGWDFDYEGYIRYTRSFND